jgi:hypothetical protein
LIKIDQNTTEIFISGVANTKIHETEMLTLIGHRECNVDVRIKITKITKDQYNERQRRPFDQETVEL